MCYWIRSSLSVCHIPFYLIIDGWTTVFAHVTSITFSGFSLIRFDWYKRLSNRGFGGLLLFCCEIKYSWDMCKSIDGLSLLYNHINWFDKLLCGISLIFVLLMSTRSYYKQMLYTIIIASCAVLFTIHQYFVSPKLALVIFISFRLFTLVSS